MSITYSNRHCIALLPEIVKESSESDFNGLIGKCLCSAAETGDASLMHALLNAKTHPENLGVCCRQKPIHICAGRGHLEALQVLIQHNGGINSRDFEDRTPLHWVAMCGTAHMIKWMVDHGASPHLDQRDGFTPLHTASCLNQETVTEQLVTVGGADINSRDIDGWTPLIMAACHNCYATVKVLASLGADLRLKNHRGDTALNAACCNGHLDVVMLLLSLGAPVNSVNDEGQTPLYQAVFHDHVPVVVFLIKAGANLNFSHCQGSECPVYFCTQRGTRDLLRLLLSAGCICSPAAVRALNQWKDLPFARGLVTEVKQFPTLKSLCVFKTRELLAPNSAKKTKALPLPEKLKRLIAHESLHL